MDETIGPNKPFKDLSWGLAAKGIAVLRYEKRTKLYAVETVDEETVNDALAAIDSLRELDEVDPERIFILGHSLGGMLAPRIAAKDGKIAGLILLAANTRNLPDMILDQAKYLVFLDGEVSEGEVRYLKEIEAQVRKVKELDIGEGEIVLGASRTYWSDLMTYDPVEVAKDLAIPMLILQGGRDYQVTMEDFEGWKEGLAGQEGVWFKFYPDLNHLFISGTGKPSPTEYEKFGNVDRIVVEDIIEWIRNRS